MLYILIAVLLGVAALYGLLKAFFSGNTKDAGNGVATAGGGPCSCF